MKFEKDTKKILLSSVIVGFVFSVLLSGILYFLSVLDVTFIVGILFHSAIFIPLGLILGLVLSMKTKINKIFLILGLCLFFAILIILIFLIIINLFSTGPDEAYGIFGLLGISPIIIIIIIIFGFILKFSIKKLKKLNFLKRKNKYKIGKIEIIFLLFFFISIFIFNLGSVHSLSSYAISVSEVDLDHPNNDTHFVIKGWKDLPFKDQRAYDDNWIDYINNNYNPKGLNWDLGGRDISMKCLSFASSTTLDWITLQEGGILYNYTNILNNRTERGHNWREMEQVYFDRVSIFDPKYDYFPIFDDIFVTHEDVPYDIEGYADIITNPPNNWYERPDSELNYPKDFNYTIEPDEYLEDHEYRPVPTVENRIKDALKKYGVLYAHVKNKVGIFRLPVHAVTLIGYGKYDNKNVFWYHDSYDGEDYTSYSNYKAIETKYISQIYSIIDKQWPTFQHDNRRTGLSITVGDVTENEHKITWSSSGDQSTDFWDGPVIAEIKDGSDEGLELIVGTENYEGTKGRVYALDGDTDTPLWSFDGNGNMAGVHVPTVVDIDGGNKEVIVTDTNGVTWVINAEDGSEEWSYNFTTNHPIYDYAVADIDLGGGKEVVVSETNNTVFGGGGYPYLPKQVVVYALYNNGSVKWASENIDNGGTSYPSIANIDNDNYPEIIISTFLKVYAINGENGTISWSSPVNQMLDSPTIADVDDDNKYEIIIGSWDPRGINATCVDKYSNCSNSIYVLNHTGGIQWNRTVDYPIVTSTAIANLDNDSNLEVIAVTADRPDFHGNPNKSIGKGTLYAFDGKTGNQEWNYSVGGKVISSPAIADIDGDGVLEIVFGAYDGLVYIVNETGGLEWTYNVSSYIFASPAIGDLDGDGVAEIAVKHAHGVGENADNRYGAIRGGLLNLVDIEDKSKKEKKPKKLTLQEQIFGGTDSFSEGGFFAMGEGEGEPSLLEILGGTNNPPVLNNLTNMTANQTDLIDINASGMIWATDIDNNTLEFYYSYPFNGSGQWQTVRGNDSGNYSVVVEVTDGNLSDYQIIYVEVYDIFPPLINVDIPVNNEVYLSSTVDFNLTLDEWGTWCGFSLDGGANVTMEDTYNPNYNYTQTGLSDGQHSVVFSCNDTVNRWNSTDVSFIVDTAYPLIDIVSPVESLNTTDNGLDVEYEYTEINPDSCWWSDNGGSNASLNCGVNITDEVWSDGTHSVIVYINDSAGNVNSSEVSFTIDTTPPNIISLIDFNETFVIDGGVNQGDNISFNVTVTDEDSEVDSVWLKIWQGAIGISNVIWQGFLNFISGDLWSTSIETNESFNFGENNYTVYVNDSLGNEVSQNGSFEINNLIINILYPTNNSYGKNVSSLNYSVVDDNAESCWYSVDNGVTNSTPVTTGTNFTNIISVEGSNTWNVYCNDSDGNEGVKSVSFYKEK